MTHDQNLRLGISPLVLCAALLLAARCEWGTLGAHPQQDATASSDLLADAPEEWPAFLSWAEAQLNQTPAAVPLPTRPRLPEPSWSLVRLDEMLADAEVTCDWRPATSKTEALVTLGPFRSDGSPQQDFRVQLHRDKKLGPGVLLTVSGFQVQREEVGSISIEVHVSFGKHFDLSWSLAGTIRVPLPDNQRAWPLRVATDGLADWSGPLNRISLRTDGVGEGVIEIRSLRFLPRRDAFPASVGVRRVRLAREIRSSIYGHCPVQVKFPNVKLPKRATLQVGLGHVRLGTDSRPPETPPATPPEAADSTAARFEIVVERDGQQTSVLDRRLEPSELWTDASASLEAWAGETVSLILKATSDATSSVVLWGNPLIYEPVDDPPCVILYLIDALGAKHMDLYGYERRTTPNLSALAAKGVWFGRAFCNSPVTVASVADILLSMPAERHGVYAASIRAPLEFVSLADALRAAGFATALFSTNVHAGPRQNTDQGFDHFIDRVGYVWERGADRTVPIEAIRDWLEVHRDRPTFLYIHTAEPHAPYVPPKGFAGRFDPDDAGSADGPKSQAGRRQRGIAQAVARYDEEVLYADARFGVFLDLLSKLHVRNRANIFVIADHGEELMEHGHWGHGPSLHTEVLHVPLIVSGPLVTARGRVDVPAQLYDIMPTILDMLGLPEPYELAGKSLLPFLRADSRPDLDEFSKRIIFHSHHRYVGYGVVQYAVIEAARWKLMFTYEADRRRAGRGRTRFSLYDLKAFTYDKEDVIDTHRDVARRLIAKLLAYQRQQHPYELDLRQEALEFDPRQIRELQALGYIESDEDEDDEDD